MLMGAAYTRGDGESRPDFQRAAISYKSTGTATCVMRSLPLNGVGPSTVGPREGRGMAGKSMEEKMCTRQGRCWTEAGRTRNPSSLIS
jgi:hypothetical protein